MTVVIADSSPLNYLTLIGSVDVLRRLYGTVVVPQQVIAELIEPAAPHKVQQWASTLPDWIEVRVAVVSDDDMTHLDAGERAAIALAQSERGALLLIDETAGRIEASRRGIRNTGTLGVLRAAALKDYVDLPTALSRLIEKVNGQVIGCVGFYHPQRDWPGVDLGWVLHRSRWGRGFATEAASAALGWVWEYTEIDRIISLIAPDDLRSIRIATKIGERFERADVDPVHGEPAHVYTIARP